MGIFVLGMHRSGTSAVTRLIGDMGAHIGEDVLPASPDNPHGFWERNDVLAANRAILKSQGCNWYNVENFDATRPLPAELEAPMQAIADDLVAHEPFVVKDPRFCLTLPYWLSFFKEPQVIVFMNRNPSAIADSLYRRNNMPPEQGHALWENYMRHAELNMRDHAVISCQFEALLADPANASEKLYHTLSAHIPGLRQATGQSIRRPSA